jgi:hypothetical protein
MQIEIISMNIWNNKFMYKERTDWVIKNIIKKKPDIIFLQEVSNHTVVELSSALKKCEYEYRISNEKRSVFEIIACRWKIDDWKFQRFSTSSQQNGILYCDISIHDTRFTLATGSIDESHDIGYEQLQCALNYLSNHNINILFGVHTHCKNELYKFKNERWTDAWEKAGKNKLHEYTLDFHRNKNVTTTLQTRPDRVFIQSNYIISKFELLGTLPIVTSGKIQTHPSLYFGLHFNIVLEI